MPYKDKEKNRMWHKNYMRIVRLKKRFVSNNDIVTPSTLNKLHPVDADGNVVYDE